MLRNSPAEELQSPPAWQAVWQRNPSSEMAQIGSALASGPQELLLQFEDATGRLHHSRFVRVVPLTLPLGALPFALLFHAKGGSSLFQFSVFGFYFRSSNF